MTIAAAPLMDFRRDQILTAAIRKTGILTSGQAPEPEQIKDAAQELELELQALQSEGVIRRTIERRTLSLVVSQPEYTLPSDLYDVELGQDDTIGTILDSGGTAETQVKTMSMGEYLQLAVKTVVGRPARCCIEKHTPLKAILWPAPDVNAATFRYLGVRFLFSGGNGANTPDLVLSWTKYLVYAVAAEVALANSLYDRGQYLRSRADGLLTKCKAGDVQHGAIVLRVGHNGRNW